MTTPAHSFPMPASRCISSAEIQGAVDSILAMPDAELDALVVSAKAEADAAPDFWKKAAENLLTKHYDN